MNKKQLAEYVVMQTGERFVTVEGIMRAMESLLAHGIRKGIRVVWPGIGTFYVKRSTRTKWRDPQKGKPITKPMRNVLRFRAAPQMHQLVAIPPPPLGGVPHQPKRGRQTWVVYR